MQKDRASRLWSLSRRLSVFLIVAFTTSCSFWSDTEPAIDTRSVAFDVADDMNSDFPLAFDLVFVSEPLLRDQLVNMSSEGWFEQRTQLLRDHTTNLSSRSYEIVPGQELPEIRLNSDERNAVGAFLFANYRTNGAHRARLDRFPKPLLIFGNRSIDIAPR